MSATDTGKLAPGTKVIKSGYAGTIVREYLPDMYEVRLASGVVVVPVEELQLTDLHRRWTTVLDNSADDRKAGRDMTGWVGVSDATDAEFKAGKVHGRAVDADDHCTPDCPAQH